MSYNDFISSRARQPAVRFSCSCDADNYGLCANSLLALQQRALPLHELFFCNDCGRQCCERCTEISIDSYFCPGCLKSFFSSTAAENKNRCESCLECPSCFHTLSTTVNASKQYSLLCEFCQWHSEEALGLSAPDPTSLLGKVKAAESGVEAEQKYAALLTQYKNRYKQSRDKNPPASRFDTKKPPHQRSSIQLHDFQRACTLLDAELARQQAALAERKQALAPEPDTRVAAMQGALGESKQAFDIHSVTSLQQRLSHPALQPFFAKHLYPRRKALSTKLAYRCRVCDKYVIKPKAGANVVYFDMQTLALSFLPTMTVGEAQTLEKGKPCKMLLYFRNPVQTDLNMKLSELPMFDQAALAKVQAASLMLSLRPSLGGHERKHSRALSSYGGVGAVPPSPSAAQKPIDPGTPKTPSNRRRDSRDISGRRDSNSGLIEPRTPGGGVDIDFLSKPSAATVQQLVSGPARLGISSEQYDEVLASKKQFKALLPPVPRAVVPDKPSDNQGGDKSKAAGALVKNGDGGESKELSSTGLKVVFPTSEISLSAFDEIAMHGEIFLDKSELEEKKKKDDPNAIGFRHLNKVGVIVEVTPLVDPSSSLTFSLLVQLTGGDKTNNGFSDLTFAAHVNFAAPNAK